MYFFIYIPDVTVQSSNDHPQLDQLEDTHYHLGDTHNSPDQLERVHDSKQDQYLIAIPELSCEQFN